MLDGKIGNAIMKTSSIMRCYTCGATDEELNNFMLKEEVNPKSLELGLLFLHTRIRLFELISLHLYTYPTNYLSRSGK